MNVWCLQHVPFEDPACIFGWARSRGHAVSVTKMYESPVQPPAAGFDLLVVLGGLMNVDEDNIYPWLAPEKRAIEQAIATDKGVLGICLGAQLVARVLGAAVRKNPHREIGWFDVTQVEHDRGRSNLSALPVSFPAFHWHGDTFDIPAGALHTAQSRGCANQAFEVGDRVVGLQFHLEYTADTIVQLMAHCRQEMTPGPWVQTVEQILDRKQHVHAANVLMEQLLDGLTQRIRPLAG